MVSSRSSSLCCVRDGAGLGGAWRCIRRPLSWCSCVSRVPWVLGARRRRISPEVLALSTPLSSHRCLPFSSVGCGLRILLLVAQSIRSSGECAARGSWDLGELGDSGVLGRCAAGPGALSCAALGTRLDTIGFRGLGHAPVRCKGSCKPSSSSSSSITAGHQRNAASSWWCLGSP